MFDCSIIVAGEAGQTFTCSRLDSGPCILSRPFIVPCIRCPRIFEQSKQSWFGLHLYEMCYIQVSELRADQSSFFVRHVTPHRLVTSVTLARWLTEVLSSGGADTTLWQQHAGRAASAAHHRHSRGPSVAQICRQADWSQCSGNYRRFYDQYI